MNLLLICLTIVTTVVYGKPPYDIYKADELFEDFIKTYERRYFNEAEKQKKLDIFKENLIKINQMNTKGGTVYGINNFADLTKEEFRTQYTGFKPSTLDTNCNVVTDKDVTTRDAPATLNWVEKGVVTAVKNQEGCGSCWAFSTIGNIESQYAIKTNKLISLSEQELVDCSKTDPDKGCNGGHMTTALTDLMSLGGVESESSYPYVSAQNTCQFNKTKIKVKVKGCINYNLKDEDKLKEVLANNGPISIAINGSGAQHYDGGIIKKDYCPETDIDHAVLLVGYGTENGTDYWLIKNSWGQSYGDNGYFKISRGHNTCGLMNELIASAEV